VGTLLTAGDGSLLGSPGGVNAGDLFTVGGAAYLIVSPGGEVTAPGIAAFPGYAGCDVLPVELATASVSRSGSNPVVVRALKATNNTFSGACTYADGATTMGYVVSILGAAPRLFRIYATGVPGP
ncbi:MAG TPA: hypothetical protein VK454_11545, partial [Myxococcaceae bacterium]|nr:hypothetical protein [Myxococcaceae bacterium]